MRKCLFCTSLLILAMVSGAFAQSDRPNFVIIIADDIGWNDLGCYGNPVVKSPNIDRLADEGIKFTNVYLTASSCSPSRCSIITGRYPHNTGAAELHTPLPAGMTTFPGELKRNGYYTASAGKWHLGPNPKADFDLVVEKGNGDGGEDQWVRVLNERPKNKPFFMWFAAFDAHRDWQADPQAAPHNPNDVVVPPYLVDAPGTRTDMAAYYDEIQRFDRFVGLVKEELRKQGALDNTLILIMSDNGRPFPRAKTRVYDSGMKTPFIVSWPKAVKSHATSDALMSVIDIAPTFLELANVTLAKSFQGISFVKVIENPAAEHRNYVFAEHNWHDYEAHERMVRDKYFMYVVNNRPQFPNQGPADSNKSPSYEDLKNLRDGGKLSAAQADVFMAPRPHEELFDCLKDPEQLMNIASNPAYASVMDNLRFVLQKWSVETGDDVPANLTKSWYDRETGNGLNVEQLRGEMPGTKTKAVDMNNKGPF